MRKKSWLKYLMYILLLCLLIFSKEYLLNRIEYNFYRSFGAGGSMWLIIILPLIYNVVIGLILGFEQLINERRKVGSWKINLPKVLLIGIPSLFFSLTYQIALINNSFVQNKILVYARLGTNFIPIFQIILGYVAITCLYKYSEDHIM